MTLKKRQINKQKRLNEIISEPGFEDIFLSTRILKGKTILNNGGMSYDIYIRKQSYRLCRTRQFRNRSTGIITKKREFFVNKHYLRMKELETVYVTDDLVEYKVRDYKFIDNDDLVEYISICTKDDVSFYKK